MTVSLRDRKFDTVKSAMAIAVAGEDGAQPWLHHRFGAAYSPDNVVKAIGATAVSDLDSNITGLQDRALFAAIRERSLVFRMRGFRRTSFRTRSITSGGAVATWVQEGKPLPVHKPTIENVGLDRFKVAGLTVATKESLERSPGFDELLFSDMAGAAAAKIDETFLTTTVTGVADVSPASITSGITPVDSTTQPELDMQRLVEAFGGDLTTAYFAMSPENAVKLGATRTGRDVGARGGEMLGIPVLTSRGAPDDSIALIDPSGLMVAWDEEAEIAVGQGGAIEMEAEADLTQDPPTGAELVSLWQANLYAFRSIAYLNWTIARTGSVAVLKADAGDDWLTGFVS